MSTSNTPSPRPIVIVTGASRGLGQAIAQQALGAGTRLLTISRGASRLDVPAQAEHLDWQHDLADAAPLAARLEAWLAQQPPSATLTVVHNAALMTTPGPLEGCDTPSLQAALRVGLEAPLVLSAALLRATAQWSGARKLVFISSGLGRFAMAGAASYCAIKAGLDHLARALALEQAERERGAKVCSLAPGVIDTDMQVQLRSADPAQFGARQRFDQLHRSGSLDSPAAAAAKVWRFIDRPDFGANPIGDVREVT